MFTDGRIIDINVSAGYGQGINFSKISKLIDGFEIRYSVQMSLLNFLFQRIQIKLLGLIYDHHHNN